MIETCSTDQDTAPTLELTDEAEDYGSVETLVEWMVGGRDEIDRQGLNDQSEDIIWLAKQYECLDILGWLELKMYREIISEPQGRHCSISIVIALGAWPLVGQIISDTEMYTGIAHWWWSLKTTLDPRAWSPKILNATPDLATSLYGESLNPPWRPTTLREVSTIREWDRSLPISCSKPSKSSI